MLRVQVETTIIDTKNGTSARTGKPYSIREQEAWMYCYDKEGKPYQHPQKISLQLEDDQKDPYPVGQYILDPASIYVGKFGQVCIRARLRASIAQAKAA